MTLALIAGAGRLPALLLKGCGVDVVVAAPEGQEVEGAREVIRFRLETLGSLLAQLASRNVDRVCFAGAIRRPPVDPARIDAATLPLVPRMMAALGQGDDATLGVVIDLFQERGMDVIGADTLRPDLLPPEGALGSVVPGKADRADATRAAAVVAALGQGDVGQACVVARGQVLAVEATPGTAWMLASVAAAREGIPDGGGEPPVSGLGGAVDWLAGRNAAGPLFVDGLPDGGLLFKAPKPGQDRRIDLPAIGPDTIAQCAAAGLRGVVIEAGGVMVLDASEVIRAADAEGLFVWIRAAT